MNGLLIAHFYRGVVTEADADAFVLEAGNRYAFVARDDARWSPWHAAILAALDRGERLADFDDGDRAKTLALLREVPTAGDYDCVCE